MGIYIKLFFTKLSMLKMYKKDFYLGLISCIIKALISIFLIEFILTNFSLVGGLESEKAAYLYFFIVFMQAVSWMLLPGIISFTGIYIRDAELDMVLLKPVNKLVYIIFENIDIKEFLNVTVNLVIFIISIIRLNCGLFTSIMLFLSVFPGVIIIFSLCLLINILGFRYKDTLMPIKFLFSLVDMCKYPLTVYNPVIRFIFTVIIPIGFISYFPIIQIKNIAWIFTLGIAVSGVFLIVSVYLFEKAFRLYESTGS